jgi:hypothetical protein
MLSGVLNDDFHARQKVLERELFLRSVVGWLPKQDALLYHLCDLLLRLRALLHSVSLLLLLLFGEHSLETVNLFVVVNVILLLGQLLHPSGVSKLDPHLFTYFLVLDPGLRVACLLARSEIECLKLAPGFELVLNLPEESFEAFFFRDRDFAHIDLLPDKIRAISVSQDHSLVLLRILGDIKHSLLVFVQIVVYVVTGFLGVLCGPLLLQHR